MKKIIIWFCFLLSFNAQANQCDSVLGDGVFKTTKVANSYYGKLVVVAEASKMTKSEAEQKFSHKGTAIVKGIPLGSEFSDEQFNSWAENIRQSLSVNQIIKYRNSILLSAGDSNVINAWSDCMNNQGGLSIYFETDSETEPVLAIKWIAYPGNPERKITIEDSYISGAKIKSGKKYLEDGYQLTSNNVRLVNLERKVTDGILVTINNDIKGKKVYLPPIIKIPGIPLEKRIISKIKFNKQYFPAITIYGGDSKGCDSWVTEELEPITPSVNLTSGRIKYTYKSHRRRGWGNCHGSKWDKDDGFFVGSVSADIKVINNTTIVLSNFSDDTDYKSPSSKGQSLVNHLKSLDGSTIK